jgi:hypothetical protein
MSKKFPKGMFRKFPAVPQTLTTDKVKFQTDSNFRGEEGFFFIIFSALFFSVNVTHGHFWYFWTF